MDQKITYKLLVHPSGDQSILCNDTYWIPCDPANSSYQKYLEWLAAGNEPEPWNPDTINGGEE